MFSESVYVYFFLGCERKSSGVLAKFSGKVVKIAFYVSQETIPVRIFSKNVFKSFILSDCERTKSGLLADIFLRFVKTAVHLSWGSFLGNTCSKTYTFINNLRLWAKNCRNSGKNWRQVLKNRNCIWGVHGNILKKKLFKLVVQVYKKFRSLSE